MNEIEINTQFQSVVNFVNQTNQLIFLTGKAGTGKTTLLKHLRQNTVKQVAVVAPTGVAAINAGGSTIHSFFQFPFAPFLPVLKNNAEADISRTNLPVLKYNSMRLSIFRKLELLVIDEISMVRADLLDQIDMTLRQTRKKWHQPFGGVQVLLIGDMHQLPPVVQADEWRLLNQVYPSPYFFDSLVIRSNQPVYIELEKIYRQKDGDFISLLNKVRNNALSPHDFEMLNQHYKPNITKDFIRDNITLTTHNKKADDINNDLLNALPNKAYRFKSKVDGSFGEKSFPADEELVLKEGARVMFLKNNAEKNYYNGKIGVINFINNDKIKVACEEDRVEIEVARETWTNIAYTINKQSKGLDEEILGTFTQFPLRLAWAITIHKSQGLSFDKVIIDAAASFSAGQVYVALSRCRSLQGLTLSSRINAESLFNDRNIQQFSSMRQSPAQVDDIFKSSKIIYIKSLLLNLFDYSEALQLRQELGGQVQAYKPKIHQRGHDWSANLFAMTDNLYQVGNKFNNQLTQLIDASVNPENDTALQTRIKQAVVYFEAELQKLMALFKEVPAFTESKEAADEVNAGLQKLFEELFAKQWSVKACANGFQLDAFLNTRMKMAFPATKISVYENAKNTSALAGVDHPQLYKQLLLLRDEICNDEHKPIYMVANGKTLKELVEFLPTNKDHLLKISGFGEAKVDAFGDRFLALIKDYMLEHDLQSNMSSMAPKKEKKKKVEATDETGVIEKKIPSKTQSFELFKQGLSLSEIAQLRGVSVATIEGHLVDYVAKGDIDIDRLVNRDKQAQILRSLDGFDKQNGLAAIKQALPDSITFSEIRYVLAYKNKLAHEIK